MTSKEKILEEIKDINYAYNDCSKYATIKFLLDEMEEERKTGYWEWVDDVDYQCSVCHTYAYGCLGEVLEGRYKYCPYCGAEMRENENEKVK